MQTKSAGAAVKTAQIGRAFGGDLCHDLDTQAPGTPGWESIAVGAGKTRVATPA